MRVTAHVFILARLQRPWTDSAGMEKMAYSANVSQLNGEVIDTIRLTKEQYDSVEANKSYLVTADYGIGKNGGYLRLVSIQPDK